MSDDYYLLDEEQWELELENSKSEEKEDKVLSLKEIAEKEK